VSEDTPSDEQIPSGILSEDARADDAPAGDGESLDHSSHPLLSDLADGQLELFRDAWVEVSSGRKVKLLGILTDLAEDNVELNFTSVFTIGMSDPDPTVRQLAVKGLWESEDRTLIRPLVGLLSRDPSPEVRAAAAMSLRPFAERAQLGQLIDRDAKRVREALMAAITRAGDDQEVTRRAVEAVGYFSGDDVDQVITAAQLSGDPLLRQSALFAMGNAVHLVWVQPLINALDEDDAAIRYEAAGALGRLGENSAVAHLVPLLKDEDTQVKVAVATALGAIGGDLAKRALRVCLELGDEPLEQAARTALTGVEFEDDPLGVKFEGAELGINFEERPD
jgi:HEAT repeat protein